MRFSILNQVFCRMRPVDLRYLENPYLGPQNSGWQDFQIVKNASFDIWREIIAMAKLCKANSGVTFRSLKSFLPEASKLQNIKIFKYMSFKNLMMGHCLQQQFIAFPEFHKREFWYSNDGKLLKITQGSLVLPPKASPQEHVNYHFKFWNCGKCTNIPYEAMRIGFS